VRWQAFTIVCRGIQIVDCGPDVTIPDVHGISTEFFIGSRHKRVPVAILSAALSDPYFESRRNRRSRCNAQLHSVHAVYGGNPCSTRWDQMAVQSFLAMCSVSHHQRSPKERPQTEGQLNTCTLVWWVLLATELCLRVPLEKCRSIVSMRFPFPFLASEVRSPEAANRH
jgi:hypothetical protein